ncbi:MAG: hypothetical protein M3O62_03650 [Pseudomonadota bacterium]|nr:hypothetical protein [Pseudomonadota bacterium]
MKNPIRMTAATTTVLLLLLAGCATTDTDAVRVEEDFGKSVRQMISAQIYDPTAAQQPPSEPPMGLDGVQSEAVLKVQREHIGDPKEVNKPMRIEVSP